METVFKQAEALQNQIVEWRRALHRIPEVGLVLPQTATFVKARLQEMGLTWQEYEGHSGMTVKIGRGSGKTVAIRADMDALPIQEETQLPYASENNNMHACGHDSHTAMLLAAAKILKEHEQELNGTVKLIFQPAEEGPGGAQPMVRDGVVADVDGIFALHIGELGGHFQPGGIALSRTGMTAADDQVRITIKGLGGHGSNPHLCVDPVVVAAAIIQNLQLIVSREVDAHDSTVITIASVEAGRGATNIIPETATMLGTIRNALPSTRDYVLQRIEEVAKGTAETLRASCTVEFFDGYPAVVNDENMVNSFLKTARKLLSEEDIHILSHGMMGGEDAGFFWQEVPGCFFFLPSCAPCPADGQIYGAHHPRFCLNESVFWRGSALLAQAAIDWLAD